MCATRIDPARKIHLTSPIGKQILTNKINNENKIFYKTIQEVLTIPPYDNHSYTNANKNHNILFGTNCTINIITTNKKNNAYAEIMPNNSTKKYLVDTKFLERTDTNGLTKNKLKLFFNEIRTTMGEVTQLARRFVLKKDYSMAKKNTSVHLVGKRLGDAIEGLYCYEPPQNIKTSIDYANLSLNKWLVTIDRPLFGHALLYKIPIIVFCSGKRDKNKPGSGMTIALRKDSINEDKLRKLKQITEFQYQQETQKIKKEMEDFVKAKKNELQGIVNNIHEQMKNTLDPIKTLIKLGENALNNASITNNAAVSNNTSITNKSYMNFVLFLFYHEDNHGVYIFYLKI